MDKGVKILESSNSKLVMLRALLYFSLGIITTVFGIIVWWLYPLQKNLLGYVVWILVGILETLYILRTPYFQTFSIYGKGITLPYPAVSNLFYKIIFKKRKEGKFLPYTYILGYLSGKDTFKNKDYEKGRKKGRDVIFMVYWNRDKRRINFTFYGENAKDIDVLKEMLIKNGVPKLPKTCPKCGKKLFGPDYINGKCLRCGYELFQIPPEWKKP